MPERAKKYYSGGYLVARENLKEAQRHVSAEKDPVMFNMIYGWQSLAEQVEKDFAHLWEMIAESRASIATPAKKKAKATKASRAKRAVGGKKRKRAR
jgi:hypothetical protein